MRTTIVILASVFMVIPCLGKTITVDDDGPAEYSTIQDAIDNSINGDTIEVQPGLYHEQINFYGKGITITSTDANNINVVYATTIDGDNAGNVVTFDSGEDATSELIGFTIQKGNDKGIYCYYSDPLISKCVLRFSKYGIYGSYAEPDIIDCVIRENSSTGIYNCDGEIINCEVVENSGCGIENSDGGITNCTINGNSSMGLRECDGAINNCAVKGNLNYGLYLCDGQISNSVISGNKNSGLYRCLANVVNCTVVGNKGDGFNAGGYSGSESLTNNIIVRNWEYGIANSSGATLKYNNVWGNLDGNYDGLAPGDTDTHEDPLFAIDGYWGVEDVWVEGDYHLKSIAGRWDPNAHIWVNDDVTSLCIDAGDPIGGCLNEPSPNGGRINQGAYGGTEKASRSPWGIEPYCAKYVPGDVNFDCKVDFKDIAITASRWLECNLVPESACWE